MDDKKILSIINEDTQDIYELDTDGGRYYFSRGLDELLFNYIYYTKKMSFGEFQKGIYNSGDINDSIGLVYESYNSLPNIPNDDEFDIFYNQMVTSEYRKIVDKYNSEIERIIRDCNQPILKDLVSQLSSLKADDTYILAKIHEDKIDKIIG